MTMELRWLSYESKTNPETGEHFMYPSTYKRLQYRVVQRYEGSDSISAPLKAIWSEWADVPTACNDI